MLLCGARGAQRVGKDESSLPDYAEILNDAVKTFSGFISSQIVCKDCNKFFWRQRTGVRIPGDVAKVDTVFLLPISIEKCPYAVLDRVRRDMKIFGGGLIKNLTGKEKAVFR